jgi:hypothetical protein
MSVKSEHYSVHGGFASGDGIAIDWSNASIGDVLQAVVARLTFLTVEHWDDYSNARLFEARKALEATELARRWALKFDSVRPRLLDGVTSAEPDLPDFVGWFLGQVEREIKKAVAKYPQHGANPVAAAMMVEAGEMGQAALKEPCENVIREGIQTAAAAMRLAMEGDPTINEWRMNRGLDLAPAAGQQPIQGLPSPDPLEVHPIPSTNNPSKP